MVTKARGLIVTAKGDNVVFVSRFFALQSGINEDPVTGSAHIDMKILAIEKKLKAQDHLIDSTSNNTHRIFL